MSDDASRRLPGQGRHRRRRSIDLATDRPAVRLDLVHQVLQVAFDWTDSHLHRFSRGGGAFARHSQLFLCPYDVDYGDNWELTIRLEQVLPAGSGCRRTPGRGWAGMM